MEKVKRCEYFWMPVQYKKMGTVIVFCLKILALLLSVLLDPLVKSLCIKKIRNKIVQIDQKDLNCLRKTIDVKEKLRCRPLLLHNV